MKNIHILPTDQPSRLVKVKDTFFITSSADIPGGTFYNIYITSDEELPYDDSIFATGAFYHRDAAKDIRIITKDTFHPNPKFCSRIILTTDPTIIADGVQAIDDEFLKWFVKNPTCEFVEVQKWTNYSEVKYKIIIPQEEPKQIYYNTVGRENGKFVIKGQFNTQKEALDLANELNKKFPDLYYDWNETLIKEEPKQESHICKYCNAETTQPDDECYAKPKQETLEEAAEKRIPTGTHIWELTETRRCDFIAGAKFQAERMYSEEEVKLAYNEGQVSIINTSYIRTEEWFEQFKKK